MSTLRELLDAAIEARESLQAFEKQGAVGDCDRTLWQSLWDDCHAADNALRPIAGSPSLEQARAILAALNHEREVGYGDGFDDGLSDGMNK